MNERLVIGILFGITILGILGWVAYEFRPRPGLEYPDLGREHVPLDQSATYNSNPPTSGPHFQDWTRQGVYDKPQHAKYLLHSLEHGYIELVYNCDFKQASSSLPSTNWLPFISHVAAQTKEMGPLPGSPSGQLVQATESAKLSEAFSSDDCKKLVSDLKAIYDKKGQRKLIVVPLPTLDARLALAAWRRLDKWNPSYSLSDADKKRIEHYINELRDQGPEKTME